MSNLPSESVLMVTAATRNNSPAAEINIFPHSYFNIIPEYKKFKKRQVKIISPVKECCPVGFVCTPKTQVLKTLTKAACILRFYLYKSNLFEIPDSS